MSPISWRAALISSLAPMLSKVSFAKKVAEGTLADF